MDRKNGIGSKIAFALLLIFLYVPIIYVVVFSFNSTKSLTNFIGFSTKWYESMFKNRALMESIWTTVSIAVIATIVSTLVGTITAIGLSKNRKVRYTFLCPVFQLGCKNQSGAPSCRL